MNIDKEFALPIIQRPVDDGLKLWISGRNRDSDTRIRDLSNYRNSGTIVGAFWSNNLLNHSVLKFDGVDDYVTTPLNVAGQTGLTAIGWFYQNNTTYSTVFGTYTSATDMAFNIDISGLSNAIQFNMKGENGAKLDLDTASNIYSLNQWVHMAATWDGSMMRIYVNGVEKASRANSDSSIEQTVSSPLTLGAFKPGSFQPFGGIIDEVRIYDRALTVDEVRKHYENTKYLFGY